MISTQPVTRLLLEGLPDTVTQSSQPVHEPQPDLRRYVHSLSRLQSSTWRSWCSVYSGLGRQNESHIKKWPSTSSLRFLMNCSYPFSTLVQPFAPRDIANPDYRSVEPRRMKFYLVLGHSPMDSCHVPSISRLKESHTATGFVRFLSIVNYEIAAANLQAHLPRTF